MLRPWKLKLSFRKDTDKAIYLQIADAIIQEIQEGRLKNGTVLPGSRTLAKDLEVNRNTIVEALNVLLNEGWLMSKERKGTFVSDILPKFKTKQSNNFDTALFEIPRKDILVRIYFDDGLPDTKIAPIQELARAHRRVFNRKGRWQMMGYDSSLGDIEFRKVVAQMLNQQRGMRTNEYMICITRGSQMAMYLVAQCLFSKGDYVMVEEPGYKPAWDTFIKAGANILSVPVDKEGIIIEEVRLLLQSKKKIKAIYITPHHQYPTTVTLSLERRLELIKLSNEYGFIIIEDDYDNEFHFGYRPIFPVSSYTELHQYIYIGTMSKVVAPALRIGYLATNISSLLNQIENLRKMIDVQNDIIMEQAMVHLFKEGVIKRHIRKATALYNKKRDFTVLLLEKYMKDKILFQIPDGGLAV